MASFMKTKTSQKKTKPFLTARWQDLVMINYEVDPSLLSFYLPKGVELDYYQNQCLVSLVGFNFLNTRLKGLALPFHCNFEEINLRFYVRRKYLGEWRRGVVFIKEIVPRRAIAWVARRFYNEPYARYPTRHVIDLQSEKPRVRYEWFFSKEWNFLEVHPQGDARPFEPGSLEDFITEHYWGYTAQKDGGTLEYAVEHPAWRVWQVSQSQVNINTAELYGSPWQEPLSRPAHSAFLAEGSAVKLFWGRRI